MKRNLSRRTFLSCSLAASGVAAAGLSLEERTLLAQQPGDAPGAERPPRSGERANASATATALPTGKVRHVEMSRLILGGNLIAGVAHARDLRYVSQLLQTYFTDEKILQTWRLAEEHGINTMSAWPSPRLLDVWKRYREQGGKLQWLGHTTSDRPFTGIKTCADSGAVGVYISGDRVDRYVREGRLDELAEAIALAKQNGLIAGVAGHPIAVPKACEAAGIDADFYMQTLHGHNYWSAPQSRGDAPSEGDRPIVVGDYASGYQDNVWCTEPDETIRFMSTVQKPWMAFKVLAAGAIPARQGFGYAFRNGADFLHVGMFDFQIAEDCEITQRILSGRLRRERPWRA
jgi:hypothetical protein